MFLAKKFNTSVCQLVIISFTKPFEAMMIGYGIIRDVPFTTINTLIAMGGKPLSHVAFFSRFVHFRENDKGHIDITGHESCKHAGARRRTQRLSAIRPFESNAIFRNLIDGWCVDVFIAGTTHGWGRLLIRKNIDNIGLIAHGDTSSWQCSTDTRMVKIFSPCVNGGCTKATGSHTARSRVPPTRPRAGHSHS